MKKFMLRLGEFICLILLAVFIAFVSSQEKMSREPLQNIEAAVVSVCDTNQLKKADDLEIRNEFSFIAENCDSCVRYYSDSVMDVRELFIIRLESPQQANAVKDSISSYVSEKIKIFESYAPEETKMLASHVLVEKNGYVLFYVGKESERAVSAFSESL